MAAPEKSVPWMTSFERLKASVAPARPEIALAVSSEPVVPPLPTSSLPSSMVVAPE